MESFTNKYKFIKFGVKIFGKQRGGGNQILPRAKEVITAASDLSGNMTAFAAEQRCHCRT